MVLPVGIFGEGSPLFTPLLEMLRRFRMALIPRCDTRMCLISLEDCVGGIIRAYEEGRIGESYILSGQSSTMREIVERCRPRWLWLGTVVLPLPLFRRMIRILDRFGRLSRHRFYYNTEFLNFAAGGLLADGGKAERELGLKAEAFEEKFSRMVKWHEQTKR
jgi:dihydroflavonol-4-reductase